MRGDRIEQKGKCVPGRTGHGGDRGNGWSLRDEALKAGAHPIGKGSRALFGLLLAGIGEAQRLPCRDLVGINTGRRVDTLAAERPTADRAAGSM